MSFWPWVSRGRLEDAKERIEKLREEKRELQEQLTRLVRGRSGLNEEPGERSSPSEAKADIPEYIQQLAQGLDSRQMQTALLREARRLHKREGLDWKEVEAQIRLSLEGETVPTSRGSSGATSPASYSTRRESS